MDQPPICFLALSDEQQDLDYQMQNLGNLGYLSVSSRKPINSLKTEIFSQAGKRSIARAPPQLLELLHSRKKKTISFTLLLKLKLKQQQQQQPTLPLCLFQMLQTPTHSHLLYSNFYPSSLLPIHHHLSFSVCLPHRTIPLSSVSAAPSSRANSWIARAGEESTSNSSASPEEEGPIELPFSAPSVFATNDDPTPLQIATSVLLTGSIAVFLFRSVRRRAKRAKELRFRSTGAKKTLKEEALENLKAFGTATIEPSKSSKQETSAVQAFLGGLTAGVIALILYKFTLTIEDGLNRQTLSDSFSVRQITITVRTIINGICYLATFVFGLNSLGLLLYSGQLALNSFSDDNESSSKVSKGQPSPTETPTEGTEVSGGGQGDLKSDEKR